MKVLLNNNEYILEQTETLSDLVSKINLSDSKGIAFAVNEKVIVRDQWKSFTFKENDRILLIKAAQGG